LHTGVSWRDWLRDHGYIVKWSGLNEPTQKAMNRELFYITKGTDGSATPKLTQKGLIVLLNEIMDDYAVRNQLAII
jgi:phage antirepressor YoqD-like protein